MIRLNKKQVAALAEDLKDLTSFDELVMLKASDNKGTIELRFLARGEEVAGDFLFTDGTTGY